MPDITGEADCARGQDHLRAALEWDLGTAYEFLYSANTLHNPRPHGLPPPWAAGVRKRLSPQSRSDFKEFFGTICSYFAYTPCHLVLEMAPPKNVLSFLDFIEAIPNDDFSSRMHIPVLGSTALQTMAERALRGERVRETEINAYRHAVGQIASSTQPTEADVLHLIEHMADPGRTKRRWLAVMREYHSVFFAEEERREKHILERMLAEAQKIAATSRVTEAIDTITGGLTLSESLELDRLVLAPSVWLHPFTHRLDLAGRELLLVWGALPAGYRLVPGESVPDQAILALRSLTDPTRVRLLRLIASDARSLQSLAHELRLSLPTVSHHIRHLRAAGLIRLELGDRGRDTQYTVRWPSAQQAFHDIEQFIFPGE